MHIIGKIIHFFKKLFHKSENASSDTSQLSLQETEANDEQILLENTDNIEESLEQFKMHNIVFEKLNYLEQYIKTFSLPFPKEYSHYLGIIQTHRKEYETELEKFSNGLLGELTFAIDPECESNRLITVSNLESEIKDFVESVVNFSYYKNKFSKLSLKLNQFYNVLLDTNQEISVITSQLNNAIHSMQQLIENVKKQHFFESDSRKKEIILNHIIYGEYIFFKSSLRCHLTSNFDEYKNNISKFHNLFIDTEYEDLVFKFFIEDLEQYQLYITTNLTRAKLHNQILRSCQSLQTRLNNYQNVFSNSNFFEELIRFENTVDNISDNNGIEFIFPLPEYLKNQAISESKVSIKDTAISVLNMLDHNSAKILVKVISNFNKDISWREFYFLCKIFELHKEVIRVASNTIFGFVVTKFNSFDARYTEYSDVFIKSEKEKLLNYHGSKSRKYVFLLTVENTYLTTVKYELQQLKLDFIIRKNNIYINHSYFNGFQNLELNFGHYKLLEELL